MSLVLAFAAAACDDEIAAENGLEAKVRVANGQYNDHHFPVDTGADASAPVVTTSADGAVVGPPSVQTIDSLNNSVVRGSINKNLRVVVDPNATTVAIGLQGDHGYWVAPVTVRSVEFAPALELTATLEFDRTIPVGPATLWFAAADKDGNYGPPRSLDLTIRDDVPTAPLVVALDWTENMDLDLVVQQPDGTTLTNKATRSAGSGADAPKIDLDSNGNCVIDAHRTENAIYTAAPAGVYNVYVRTAAPCGVVQSGWRVRLLRDGNVISTVNGVSYAYEADVPNGGPSGTGRFALSFTLGG